MKPSERAARERKLADYRRQVGEAGEAVEEFGVVARRAFRRLAVPLGLVVFAWAVVALVVWLVWWAFWPAEGELVTNYAPTTTTTQKETPA